MSTGSLDEGEAALTQAIKLKPSSARSYLKLAEVQRDLAHYEDAIESIDSAIEINSEMPILWARKAQLQNYSGRPKDAWVSVEKAKGLAAEHPAILSVLADMHLVMNEKDKAREFIDKALEQNDRMPGYYFLLKSMHKFTKDDPHFERLLNIIEQDSPSLDPMSNAALYYTLFSAYEDIGDYKKAFDALKKASEFKLEFTEYNSFRAEENYIRNINKCSPAFLRSCNGKGYDSDVPVFIVGMPRSGTTLTEQIISSHPDVHPGGELAFVTHAMRYEGATTPSNARASGERYVSMLRALDPTGKAKRITDKMPGNFARLGQIISMLPNAKIVHCRRNAMDTLLSCYKQNFANGQTWSYSLQGLAEEYNRYERVMDYWRKVLPGRFLEINYEDTVEDIETQARRLINYVGLEWNDLCLEPHKQKRPVLTASKAQVIQPVYKTSVGSWHRYKDQLQETVDLLENKDSIL